MAFLDLPLYRLSLTVFLDEEGLLDNFSFLVLKVKLLEISMVLSLARPEYLKVLTPKRFPGSEENCTEPSLAVLPLLVKKELLSLIRCQTKAADILVD